MTSSSELWETPPDLYAYLNKRFNFTLDPCATNNNHLCGTYFTEEQNGLAQDWAGHRVYMNPPYGKHINSWVKKAYEESIKGAVGDGPGGALVVGLLPARVDTRWWNNWVHNKADIHFLKGRLKFSNSKMSAPFPSAIVIWSGIDEVHKSKTRSVPKHEY